MTKHEPLGKYRILAELGKGGFATVYRAEDTTLEREVALKVLDPLLMRDAGWVARFRQEAKSVANLRHPHIVSIHEIGEVGGRLYIAMELARGGSLAEAIAVRGRIPWNEALTLLQPICEALDYAHGQGVIHRDLKPANILLDPEAGPLLTDFGFARLMSDNSMSVSLSGGILGTPAYIAPEVWELDQAAAPADIYALGCIVYEMLVGKVLFSGKTPMQSMHAHDKGPQYPAAWPEGVPENVVTVLDKALARAPEKRYPAAGTFWHALSDLEGQAESVREAAKRAAIAAQWHAEVEAAMEEGEWSAAKMAVGRWLAVTPGDKDALAIQTEIAQQMTGAEQPVTPLHFVQKPIPAQYQPDFGEISMLVEPVAQDPATVREQRVEQPAVPATQSMLLVKTKASRRMPTWAWVLGAVGLLVLVICAVMYFLPFGSALLDSLSAGSTAAITSVAMPFPEVTTLIPTSTPTPAVVVRPRRILYIYYTDSVLASEYKDLLLKNEFDAEIIDMNAILETDFSRYGLVIIGPDTIGSGEAEAWYNAWGDSVSVAKVADSNLPVIGLGQGGQGFFGRLDLDIGGGNAWHGQEQGIIMADSNHVVFRSPNSISGEPLIIYSVDVPEDGTYMPYRAQGVILIGREIEDQHHYPIIQQTRFMMWGFNASPTLLTEDGRLLFENVVHYMLGGNW